MHRKHDPLCVGTLSRDKHIRTFPFVTWMPPGSTSGKVRYRLLQCGASLGRRPHCRSQGCRLLSQAGGRILFQMGGQGNAAEVFHVLQELMSKPQWKRYFKAFVAPYHFYGPKQYEDWLPQCGFSATRIELMPRICNIADQKASSAGSVQHGFLSQTTARETPRTLPETGGQTIISPYTP